MEQPKLINNITERVVDDLRQRLSVQSRVSIAAASFPRVRPLPFVEKSQGLTTSS